MNSSTHSASATHLNQVEGVARWTALAATLCGIHCFLTPLLVVALPFLAVGAAFEWGAFWITLTLGTGVALMGPTRNRSGVLCLLGVGAAIWAASLQGLFEPLPESVTSPLGSVIFAGGMVWSARICRSGACDICENGSGNEESVT